MDFVTGGVNDWLVNGAELQRRIDEMDAMLSATVQHPNWFIDPVAVREWIEGEIAQLEAEQLSEIENSRPGRRLNSEKSNLITPIVPQWQSVNKGDEVL